MGRITFQGLNNWFSISALLVTVNAVAATGPSWQQQPSWANENGSSPSRKSTLTKENYQIAPPFTPGSNNLSVDVGQIFLMGDLHANYGDSIGTRIHYTYGVSDLFAFDGSLGYSEHSEGKFSMTTALAGLRTNLAWYDKVVPYFTFGLGFYRPSYQIISGPNTSSIAPILFGVHLGPGVNLEISQRLFFGASVTFHSVFGSTKTTPTGPLTVGGTFTSFFLNAGVTF